MQPYRVPPSNSSGNLLKPGQAWFIFTLLAVFINSLQSLFLDMRYHIMDLLNISYSAPGIFVVFVFMAAISATIWTVVQWGGLYRTSGFKWGQWQQWFMMYFVLYILLQSVSFFIDTNTTSMTTSTLWGFGVAIFQGLWFGAWQSALVPHRITAAQQRLWIMTSVGGNILFVILAYLFTNAFDVLWSSGFGLFVMLLIACIQALAFTGYAWPTALVLQKIINSSNSSSDLPFPVRESQ